MAVSTKARISRVFLLTIFLVTVKAQSFNNPSLNTGKRFYKTKFR